MRPAAMWGFPRAKRARQRKSRRPRLERDSELPQGAVNNFGHITADAGTIALQAQVVNQNGILQADSVQNQNGVIELVASDSLNLGADSQILARGDNPRPAVRAGT